MLKATMRRRKILVVLDDVDHIDQLEALAGEPNWFKSGSRIIITTRDEQVLLAHRVLSPTEEICLFSMHAFQTELAIEGYKKLSEQVLRYASGLPLTIKVLGSFLCGKNEHEWEDTIQRLKTIPLKETMQILELSYNSLEEDFKEIFLDVACTIKGWFKEDAIIVLESQGFRARIGLRVLEQKSLINFDKDGFLQMHDHLEEMGRNIFRRLSPDEPNKRSKLWIDEEIEDILANDSGTQATKCLKFGSFDFVAEIAIKHLANMNDLKFLDILIVAECNGDSNSINWKFDKGSQYLPSSLRIMRWISFPFSSLPNTFQGENLAGLVMYDSNIVQLWEDGEEKILHKLRFFTFQSSKLQTFDLRMAPNLERLTIYECYYFRELHMPAHFLKLKYLNLTHSKLTTLHLGCTPNLERLILKDSNDLVELQMPTECLKLEYLEISYSQLKTIHLGNTLNLERLILEGCNDLIELQMPIESLKLKYLELKHSKLTNLHLGNTPNLERLILEGCNDLVELQMPIECLKLKYLDLSHSKLRILDLGLTPNLNTLNLENCYGLVDSINEPVGCLRNLSFLDLSGCGSFEYFLFDKHLDSHEVGSLSELHLIAEPTNVCPLHSHNDSPKFQFSCYYKEDPDSSFGNLERLISIGLCACTNLETFSGSICSLQCIRKLTLEGGITEAPRDLDQLECLEELIFSSTDIRNLLDSICKLKRLKSLELKSCLLIEKLPDDLGRIDSLKTLTITDCNRLRDIPNNIGKINCVISPKVYKRYTHGKYKQ